MRGAVVLFLCLTVACRDSSTAEQAETSVPTADPCRQQVFESARFTVCRAHANQIEMRSGFRNFAQLQQSLGKRADQVAFAMNAGMYDEGGRPIGLFIERGKQLHRINRNKGGGNFHLLPNGVFVVRNDGTAAVMASTSFSTPTNLRHATQSGPMLVIDGKLHSKFEEDGESRLIRNGVGVAPTGEVVFVISEDPVSFGKFARFYRDSIKSTNALFLDGSVSSLWNPAAHRMDAGSEIGPIIVVFRTAESAPDRGDRAKP